MNIILVNTPECPCPYTHYLHNLKFLKSFEYWGYTFLELNNISDYNVNSENDIFYLSNHNVDIRFLNKLENRFGKAKFILWYYHNYYNQIPFRNWILTGEHFRKEPQLESHKKSYNFQKTIENYIPLTFLAGQRPPFNLLVPEDIGKLVRDEKYNCQFVGTRYKGDWIENLENSFIKFIPPIVDESERVESFLSSKICLGFHHDDNIRNNVIGERVFESMSYGCLTLTDNPVASELIKPCIYVSSKDDMLSKIDYYLTHNKERIEIQKDGYEYIKKEGLYIHLSRKFINYR